MLTSRCIKQIRLWSYDFALNSVYFASCVFYMHRPWLKVSNISRPITSAKFNLSVCLFDCLFVCAPFLLYLFIYLFVCVWGCICFSFLSFYSIYIFYTFLSLFFFFFSWKFHFIFWTLGHHDFLSFEYLIFSSRLGNLCFYSYGKFLLRLGLPCLVQLLTWYTCRTTVIFGTLKDDSHLIKIVASNNCFSHRNIFQNGVNTLSKWFTTFCEKAQNFI